MTKRKSQIECAACGKIIAKDTKIIKAIIDDTYSFDNSDCVLIFKKLRAAYGNNLFTTK